MDTPHTPSPDHPARRVGQQKYQFIRKPAIRNLAHSHGRRVSIEFLDVLEGEVKQFVLRACKIHNGGKKTLDKHVAHYVKGME